MLKSNIAFDYLQWGVQGIIVNSSIPLIRWVKRAAVFLVCDFTIRTLHFSSCVIFNSFPKLLICFNASKCLRHNWSGFFLWLHSATLFPLVHLSVSIMTIVGINTIWSVGVCYQLLWQIINQPCSTKTLCFWALAWSNQVPITSPVNTFLLCVTFTMFCTSFLTTKTQPPLLCKQQIITHQWVCRVIFKFWTWTCPIYCINELPLLSPPAWNFFLKFLGDQAWWIILPSLSQSWPNTQSFSRPTTTSSSPRNMRWVDKRFKGQSFFWVLISV